MYGVDQHYLCDLAVSNPEKYQWIKDLAYQESKHRPPPDQNVLDRFCRLFWCAPSPNRELGLPNTEVSWFSILHSFQYSSVEFCWGWPHAFAQPRQFHFPRGIWNDPSGSRVPKCVDLPLCIEGSMDSSIWLTDWLIDWLSGCSQWWFAKSRCWNDCSYPWDYKVISSLALVITSRGEAVTKKKKDGFKEDHSSVWILGPIIITMRMEAIDPLPLACFLFFLGSALFRFFALQGCFTLCICSAFDPGLWVTSSNSRRNDSTLLFSSPMLERRWSCIRTDN